MKFGVMIDWMNKIQVGSVNEAETEFVESQDLTGEVVLAALNFILMAHKGTLDVDVNGLSYHVEISKNDKKPKVLVN